MPHAPLFVFAGGGSGGHLYPALGVVRALRELLPEAVFAFLATNRAIDERVLSGTGCELVGQPVRPLRPTPWTWPGFLKAIADSRRMSRARFSRQRPAIVVGTGGFASFPGVMEARRPNPHSPAEPRRHPRQGQPLPRRAGGLRLRPVRGVGGLFPRVARVEVLGCPVRPEFGRVDRAAGCRAFDMDPSCPILLVTGASQGARSVNEAVTALAGLLKSSRNWQVLHLTGDADFDATRSAYEAAGLPARVHAYTHEMPLALAAADLVVSRAGASTLAEITASGRASILLPYPYDRGVHQRSNAMCLVRAGAAALVHDERDSAANARALRPVLEDLLENEPRRCAMAAAARALGRPDAACEIARRLLEMSGVCGPQHGAESLQQTCVSGR